ncbi:peptidoglycan-binding protein [Ensifer sp.]|jgi:peptidoglycan hydrolase-like protein with peptidoglycan-binding domain|uniref:peptidoglycan-binding protein n=1 Tax=Ensifer sp. TaxID=1872086 RepID=UPI002E1369C8|nr:peptidoglycan-binding protein [Ensifer sp.]
MASNTESMRQAWAKYECKRREMTEISFGPDLILVAPPTVEAWKALERVLQAFDYDIRIEDTDSYNCREIKGGGGKSLHSYGIALDINWHTNPFLDHKGERPPRFSNKASQSARAADVRLGKADTDMTREMVDATLAIRTAGPNPRQVFAWGGDWNTIKDSMHFQIQVTPDDLSHGIDWNTVKGGRPDLHDEDVEDRFGGGPLPEERWTGFPWQEPLMNDFAAASQETLALQEGDSGPMVKALQAGLAALNYQLGDIDGDFGTLTRDALLSFQANNGLPTTGVADAETIATLGKGRPRVLTMKRMTATEHDLEERGSKIIRATGWNRWLGIGTGILGALGLSDSQMHFVTRIGDALKESAGATNGAVTSEAITATVQKVLAQSGSNPADAAKGIQDAITALVAGAQASALPQNSGGAFLEPVISLAQGLLGSGGAGPWAMLIGAGVFIWRNAKTSASARLADHRTGANVSR